MLTSVESSERLNLKDTDITDSGVDITTMNSKHVVLENENFTELESSEKEGETDGSGASSDASQWVNREKLIIRESYKDLNDEFGDYNILMYETQDAYNHCRNLRLKLKEKDKVIEENENRHKQTEKEIHKLSKKCKYLKSIVTKYKGKLELRYSTEDILLRRNKNHRYDQFVERRIQTGEIGTDPLDNKNYLQIENGILGAAHEEPIITIQTLLAPPDFNSRKEIENESSEMKGKTKERKTSSNILKFSSSEESLLSQIFDSKQKNKKYESEEDDKINRINSKFNSPRRRSRNKRTFEDLLKFKENDKKEREESTSEDSIPDTTVNKNKIHSRRKSSKKKLRKQQNIDVPEANEDFSRNINIKQPGIKINDEQLSAEDVIKMTNKRKRKSVNYNKNLVKESQDERRYWSQQINIESMRRNDLTSDKNHQNNQRLTIPSNINHQQENVKVYRVPVLNDESFSDNRRKSIQHKAKRKSSATKKSKNPIEFNHKIEDSDANEKAQKEKCLAINEFKNSDKETESVVKKKKSSENKQTVEIMLNIQVNGDTQDIKNNEVNTGHGTLEKSKKTNQQIDETVRKTLSENKLIQREFLANENSLADENPLEEQNLLADENPLENENLPEKEKRVQCLTDLKNIGEIQSDRPNTIQINNSYLVTDEMLIDPQIERIINTTNNAKQMKPHDETTIRTCKLCNNGDLVKPTVDNIGINSIIEGTSDQEKERVYKKEEKESEKSYEILNLEASTQTINKEDKQTNTIEIEENNTTNEDSLLENDTTNNGSLLENLWTKLFYVAKQKNQDDKKDNHWGLLKNKMEVNKNKNTASTSNNFPTGIELNLPTLKDASMQTVCNKETNTELTGEGTKLTKTTSTNTLPVEINSQVSLNKDTSVHTVCNKETNTENAVEENKVTKTISTNTFPDVVDIEVKTKKDVCTQTVCNREPNTEITKESIKEFITTSTQFEMHDCGDPIDTQNVNKEIAENIPEHVAVVEKVYADIIEDAESTEKNQKHHLSRENMILEEVISQQLNKARQTIEVSTQTILCQESKEILPVCEVFTQTNIIARRVSTQTDVYITNLPTGNNEMFSHSTSKQTITQKDVKINETAKDSSTTLPHMETIKENNDEINTILPIGNRKSIKPNVQTKSTIPNQRRWTIGGNIEENRPPTEQRNQQRRWTIDANTDKDNAVYLAAHRKSLKPAGDLNLMPLNEQMETKNEGMNLILPTEKIQPNANSSLLRRKTIGGSVEENKLPIEQRNQRRWTTDANMDKQNVLNKHKNTSNEIVEQVTGSRSTSSKHRRRSVAPSVDSNSISSKHRRKSVAPNVDSDSVSSKHRRRSVAPSVDSNSVSSKQQRRRSSVSSKQHITENRLNHHRKTIGGNVEKNETPNEQENQRRWTIDANVDKDKAMFSMEHKGNVKPKTQSNSIPTKERRRSTKADTELNKTPQIERKEVINEIYEELSPTSLLEDRAVQLNTPVSGKQQRRWTIGGNGDENKQIRPTEHNKQRRWTINEKINTNIDSKKKNNPMFQAKQSIKPNRESSPISLNERRGTIIAYNDNGSPMISADRRNTIKPVLSDCSAILDGKKSNEHYMKLQKTSNLSFEIEESLKENTMIQENTYLDFSILSNDERKEFHGQDEKPKQACVEIQKKEVDVINRQIKQITLMSQSNDLNVYQVVQQCQTLVKENSKALRKLHTENKSATDKLESWIESYMILKRKNEEGAEIYQRELKKSWHIENEYKIQIKNLCDMINRLSTDSTKERKQIEHYEQLFNLISHSLTDLDNKFEFIMQQANDKVTRTETKLKSLILQCEILQRNNKNQESSPARKKKQIRNLFKLKRRSNGTSSPN